MFSLFSRAPETKMLMETPIKRERKINGFDYQQTNQFITERVVCLDILTCTGKRTRISIYIHAKCDVNSCSEVRIVLTILVNL